MNKTVIITVINKQTVFVINRPTILRHWVWRADAGCTRLIKTVQRWESRFSLKKGRSFRLYEGEGCYWWSPQGTSNNDQHWERKTLVNTFNTYDPTLILIFICILNMCMWAFSVYLLHSSNFNETNMNFMYLKSF